MFRCAPHAHDPACWRRCRFEPPADRRLRQGKRAARGVRHEFRRVPTSSLQTQRKAQIGIGVNSLHNPRRTRADAPFFTSCIDMKNRADFGLFGLALAGSLGLCVNCRRTHLTAPRKIRLRTIHRSSTRRNRKKVLPSDGRVMRASIRAHVRYSGVCAGHLPPVGRSARRIAAASECAA